MSVTIYIPLEGEGTDTWRPVHADHVEADIYEIAVEQEPPGEHWAFPPRSLVRCRDHVFDDGHQGLLAVELVQLRAT